MTTTENQTEQARLAAADAAIDAHACELGPESCEECDRLWGERADAHDGPTYQLALDANDSHSEGGVQHIVAAGDATPLCGTDDLTLTPWTDMLTEEAAGAALVAPEHATCGKCADDFWSNCA